MSSSLYLNEPLISPINFKSENNLSTSANGYEHIIVYFNSSSYNEAIKSRFVYYGGILKENNDWNSIFNKISGFAGIIPSINITNFENEFPSVNIERDELIETQMNYATMQTHAVNSTWYINGYKGNIDSSIAVLDTGINSNHDYFNGNIIGWQNFVNDDLISDDNGHGTFISSVIAGTGTDPYNSDIPSTIRLYGNYSHIDLFEDYIPAKNYSVKIFSTNLTKTDSRLNIKSFWNYSEVGINKFWYEIYYNNSLVNASYNANPNQLYTIDHDVSYNGPGIYDVYIKYYKTIYSIPKFFFNANLTLIPEVYTINFNHFTGVANASNILSYKVANQSGLGYTSDLISALGSLIQNRSIYKIVSVCLSMGTVGNNVITINRALDEVSENGIVVVIAAGNMGITGSDPLNKLAINKKAIVVGAINDEDQVTSYSSMGREVDSSIIKPDIVAPGGSRLKNHRSIISADGKSTDATATYGTSISTAIVSAAVNLLIEAKWGSWVEWENQDFTERVNFIKSVLLMTASETNQDREDDPESEIDESEYSPSSFFGTTNSLKDVHEGYGRVNIESAINALTEVIEINSTTSEYLTSSKVNPLGDHVFARRILMNSETQYLFNLTDIDQYANFDLFLFSNESNQYGEPILLASSRKWYGDSDSLYFTPKKNQTDCIMVIKAINGSSSFTLNISTVNNFYTPQLDVPLVTYFGGSKNTTVMGFQEFSGGNPLKNYSIDRYRFYIEYFDNDTSNVPPQEVYVSILETSKNYTLTPLFEFNTNYTEGVIFQSEYIELSKPDTYHYFFIASDGSHQVRYPGSGELNIIIEFPTDSEPFPYNHSFNEGLGNWRYNGTGWGLLNQSNFNDNRSEIYQNDWQAIYFGRDHNYPSNYTYQPYIITEPFPNGTFTSPLFNLTQLNENYTHPFAKFGLRTSINSGDFIYLQINLNWTGWITLRSYSNIERDWFLEEFNLTQYIGYFIQFRFLVSLDNDFDAVNYKGLMLDYFALENKTNIYIPEIDFDLNADISSFKISKFENVIFTCRYYDADNNYPENIFLEIGDSNYTMLNVFGNWNSTFSSPLKRGILFRRTIAIGNFDNRSFRFHISDGKYLNTSQWYNIDNSLFTIVIPIPLQYLLNQSNILIGYNFSSGSMTDYYVSGTPLPKETTAWLMGDNTWHPITRLGQNFLYGGRGQSYGGFEQGYGINWDANLITYPLHLQGEHSVYLKYNYEISLQNEFNLEVDELDKCIVSISIDYGMTWIILKEYFYDSEQLSGNEVIDISNYLNKDIMIMFTVHSNDNVLGLGYGWLLSNIYVGYDEFTDFVPPNINIFEPLDRQTIKGITSIKANISDDAALDSEKLYVFINNKAVDQQLLRFDLETGVLLYEWDTRFYNDGIYQIKVIAFDKEGNSSERSIEIIINNGFFNWRTINPWIIIIIGIAVTATVISILVRRHGKKRSKKTIVKKIEKYDKKRISKDQAKRRVELIETGGELKRPYTLHCKFCKSWFESDKFNYICPICEHDQLYAAYNCINCGRWFMFDEPGENYFCKKCEGIRLVRRELREVKELLGKEGKLLRKFEFKKKKFSILD